MYLDFYKISKDSFQMTPDAATAFWSISQTAALTALVEGFEARNGLIVITDEIGLGKTTVLRSYLKRITSEHPRIIHVPNGNLYLSFKGLLKTMLAVWGAEDELDHLTDLLERLHQVLREDYHRGRAVMLFIDEAQNLPLVTLKHLTMLSNLETNTDKLLQIVLVGQPELNQILKRTEFRQLTQRIERYERLIPFTTEESLSYIRYRLDKTAPQGDTIFSQEASHALIQAARGNPRVLNTLCANTLVEGARQREKPISAQTVKQVLRERKDRSITRYSQPRLVYVMGAAAALVLALLWFALPRASVTAKTSAATSAAPDHRAIAAAPKPDEALTTDKNAILSPGRVSKMATFPLTIFVGEGEDLSSIALDIYGFVNPALYAAILQHNPQLRDFASVKAGDKLVLPAVPATREPSDRR